MKKIVIAMSLILSCAILAQAQAVTKGKLIKRDSPVNCEDLLAFLDVAIIDWRDIQETHFIVVSRLGTGERNKNLNRARLEYVEDYLKRKEVQYLLTEGPRVEGPGRFEVYVGGRLAISIPTKRNIVRLCWGTTGA